MQSEHELTNIVLTGLMGTGKSTVGGLLAKNLGRQFIDTDEYIEQHYGPVTSIFDQADGDEQFLLIEEQVAYYLSKSSSLVIATGGRFMVNQKNIDVITGSADVICLIAELDDIVSRLLASGADTFRPRFDKAPNKLALMELLEQQSKPFYSQFVQLQTTGLYPSEVVVEINKWLTSQRV